MHRFLIHWMAGFSLLALSLHAGAQTDAGTAEALMRSSGMWQQLASLSPQARSGFLQGAALSEAKPSQAEIDRLSKTIADAYASDRLRSAALATFKSDLNAAHVPALRRWYGSRTGKKVTGMEEAAAAAQTDLQEVAQRAAVLLSAMPPARRALLEELVVVTRSAESATQMTIDTALAAHLGMLSVTPNAPSDVADALRLALEAQRPQWLQAFAGLSLASMALAYVELPTSELSRYVGFLKSEPGRHFTSVGLKALGAALIDAAAELGRRLPGTLDGVNS